MKIKRIQVKDVSLQAIEEFGYNILADSEITVIDRKTGQAPIMHLKNDADENAMVAVVSQEDRRTHIDIFCESADIVFDIKKAVEAETVFISSYWNPKKNYCLGDFAVFGSLDKETLFNDENMLARETDGADWVAGGGLKNRNHADWLYEAEGTIRYFGIRVFKANATDDVIRPKNIGIYNSKYTRANKFISDKFGKNILSGLEPKSLTNGYCFDDNDLLYLNGKKHPTSPLISWLCRSPE